MVSFAVDAAGAAWSWGSSRMGQLGLSRQWQAAKTPQRIRGLPGNVVQVAAGWGHAAALTGESRVSQG